MTKYQAVQWGNSRIHWALNNKTICDQLIPVGAAWDKDAADCVHCLNKADKMFPQLDEMSMAEYQLLSAKTDKCPGDEIYHILALAGEAGEVAGKMSKIIRDHNGNISPEQREALGLELGDVLWHLTQAARALGFTLDRLAISNIEKLYDRENRGKISGSGDNR